MSTTAHTTSRPTEVPSNCNSAHPREDVLEDDEDTILTIKDVKSLKKGFIRISNEANKSCTILLVGETGVGKSSFLELIANVLTGNDIDHYDFNILDKTNERGGSANQSQTMEAHLYKFTSNDGTVVHILDTPGLADTRGILQDELHKEHIVTQIKKHTDSITAVLVLANGTVPHMTVGTKYALSTLTANFPGLANNIAFVFTNVLVPLYLNIPVDTIPYSLKDAPQFLLDNPLALQRKYLKLQNNQNMWNKRTKMRKVVEAGEQNGLEMLVEFLDWLGSLKPHLISQANSAPQNSNSRVTSIISALRPISNLWNRLPSMFRSKA